MVLVVGFQMINLVKKWFKSIYHQLVEINDSPHSIAMGLGIGVFLGIYPGVGPLVSLCVAVLLRVNKAAAILGSVLTNTWFSLLTLALAVQIGSGITGTEEGVVKQHWKELTTGFSWDKFFNTHLLEMLYPIFVGFFVISLVAGILTYIVAYIVLYLRHKTKRV